MFQKNRFFISIAICFLSLFLFLTFRTVPVTRLWDGYQILYVASDEISENDVLSVLDKYSVKNVVTKSRQKIPVYSDISPVQAQSKDSYLFARNVFFTDETNKCMVFYVPGNQASGVQKTIDELSSFSKTAAGTDSSRTFPWVPPAIVLIFAVFFTVISSSRKTSAAVSVFPVILAFTRPLFTVACCCCLCICGFGLLQNIFKRKGFLKTAMRSVYLFSLFVIPVAVLFITSPVSSLFYILCFCSSVSLVFILEYIEDKKISSKTTFTFVYIRSAKMIPLIGHKGLNLILVTCLCVILIFVSSLLSSAFSVSKESSSLRPALPSPVSGTGTLPDMDDVNQWAWNTMTFPYRKLDEERLPAVEGATVSVPEYTERNGVIVSEEKPVFVYNSNFRSTVSGIISHLDYPSLEKMMLEQGKNTEYGYSTSAGSAYERFGTVLVIILTFIPVILAGYYIMGRRRYGLSI